MSAAVLPFVQKNPHQKTSEESVPEGSVEQLLREVLVASAAQSAELKGLAQRVDGVQSDAREARDAARDSLAQTRAQDLPAKIAELRGYVEKLDQGQRSDLVNAVAKLTTETRTRFDDNEDRIVKLEAFTAKLSGAGGVFGWLAKYAPWLLTVLMGGLAAVGLKERMP